MSLWQSLLRGSQPAVPTWQLSWQLPFSFPWGSEGLEGERPQCWNHTGWGGHEKHRTELAPAFLGKAKATGCGQHRELLLPSSSLDPPPCLPHSSKEGKTAKTRAVGSTRYANTLDALPSSRLRQGFLCIYIFLVLFVFF